MPEYAFWWTGLKNYSIARRGWRWYWEVDRGDGGIVAEGMTLTKWGARRCVRAVDINATP